MAATGLTSSTERAERALAGRTRELGELQAALEQAIAGRGRLVLVTGEPGIGKTRLAEEVCATAEGAEVLWGRCWQGGGAPAFWPWVQVIRAYARGRAPAELAAQLEACAPFVVHLVPELREALPDVAPDPLASDSQEARFALFDAVTRFFASASDAAPLVIVLDDLHAADAPSLLFLQYLARELSSTRVLVVGAYRDIGAASPPDVAGPLAELLRAAQHIALRGLDVGEVGRLLEQETGSAPAAEGAASIHRATGGNPLFLMQVLELLADEVRVLLTAPHEPRVPLPPGVREAIAARLNALPQEAVETLTLAAVIGDEPSLLVLQEVSRRSAESVLAQLAKAAQERLVVKAGSPSRFRFAHGLIRDALYEALDPAARPRLHREVGLAIERLAEAEPGPQFAALAHHFSHAAPIGEAERAVRYAVGAAERAMGLLGYEDAVTQYELALAALDLADGPQIARRCDILLGLAAAEQRAGHADRARTLFGEAAALARDLDDTEQLASAAVAFGAAEATVGAADEHAVKLLEEALERLPPEDSPLRARALARLARALYFGDERERRAELCRQAVEVARRCDDDTTLLEALCAEHVVTWDPDNVNDRLRSTNEIIALAHRLKDREAEIQGRLWRRRHLLEVGDTLAADHEAGICVRLADELRQPRFKWQVTNLQAGRALLAGRFDDAERLAHAALETGRTVRGATAEAVFLLQMRIVCAERGRLEEVAPQIERLAELHDAWRADPLYHLTKMGREPEARALFEQLAADDFRDLPRDMFALWTLAYLADACVYLRDPRRAVLLYELLLPYRDRCLVMGQSGGTEGALARHLGRLAALLERWEEASGHFERALEIHARMGARPLLAHTQQDCAAALLEQGRREDRERASRMLAEALATADELGMTVLAERTRLASRPTRPQASTFRREGDYWTIAFEGSEFRLRSGRGLAHIAYLLARPNEQIHALELAGADVPGTSQPTSPARLGDEAHIEHRLGLGDAGELLDAQAKAAYRKRLDDLRDELEEAQSWSDPERAAKLASEIDFLTHELARAVGMRGRDRRAASPAERARISVTKAIKRASAKIAKHDARLAEHLALTIRTGTFCSYAPGLPDAPAWETSQTSAETRRSER